MLGRRLLIVVAILMAVTALTAGLTAPPREDAEPTPAPETISGGTSSGEVVVVERTLEVGDEGPQTVAVEEGEILRLTVAGDVLDVVELVGLDRTTPISPELAAEFDVLADRPGTYPVQLVDAGTRVGTLRVTPDQE